jgi:hypothetical protein
MELRPPRKRHLLPYIPRVPCSKPPPNPNPIRAHLCPSVVNNNVDLETQQRCGSGGTSPSPKNKHAALSCDSCLSWFYPPPPTNPPNPC